MHPPVRLRPMGGDEDSGARRAGSARERGGHAASAGAQAVRTLGLVTAALPHVEPRSGQADMAEAVAEAVVSGRHLVVQAGTGTGKSLAYLVPAILSGRPTVVTTATKALQDQLATKDLPFLAEQLDVEFAWAVLKGRSNYLCLQRVREVRDPGSGQLELEDLLPSNRHEVERLATWAATTTTGDRAELDWSPSERAWAAVSVSSEECPGAQRCPLGEPCFAETARRRAAAADVVVVNTHLYGIDVGSGGAILPEHEVVVIDEAHQLEDITSDTAGLAIGAGRFANLARLAHRILADPEPTSASSWQRGRASCCRHLSPGRWPSRSAAAAWRSTGSSPRCDPSRPTWPRPTSAARGRRRRRRRWPRMSTPHSSPPRERWRGSVAGGTSPGWRSRRSTWPRCSARASGRSARPS